MLARRWVRNSYLVLVVLQNILVMLAMFCRTSYSQIWSNQMC